MSSNENIVKEILPDLSEESREKFKEEVSEETGIDFNDFRTSELGAQIADLTDIFSWIGLCIILAIILVPAIIIYFSNAILPAITPISGVMDILYILLAVCWAIITFVIVGSSWFIWIYVKRMTSTTGDFLELLLDLMDVTSKAVKECSPSQFVKLIVANAMIVLYPLVTAAIIAKFSLGKVRLPGTVKFANWIAGLVVMKVCLIMVDEISISSDEEECEDSEDEKESTPNFLDKENSLLKKSVRDVTVDSTELLHTLSSNLHKANSVFTSLLVKPLWIISIAITILFFVMPLFLYL